MQAHNVNNLDNFICGWYLDDLSICDELVDYYQKDPFKEAGGVGNGTIDTTWKDSTDSVLQGPLTEKYFSTCLRPCLDRYVEKYSYSNYYGPWSIVQGINVQHYQPGGAFHAWHTERSNANGFEVSRHLVFMTYLNTVDDAGETEFFHQKLKIKPEKGLTIIWPADWTFTHRGIPSPNEEKYIVTGWLNYT